MTGERAICIHGHFYQPPRENPWLEAIEVQESAAPYHDWNERVTAECYTPNSAARILGADGTIRRILNNYSRINFNIGPTLLSWMQERSPDVYAAILEADIESQSLFAGHGSAIAQAYSHMILPLANARDRETQVQWAVADFRMRFGREPEGFWLPETAVDIPSLEALAAAGIRFTILAPHQIKRVRATGTSDWTDVTGSRVDPRMPYLVRLPSGRSISVFAYDGPIAHDVSFGDLLENGERFANRLMGAFDAAQQRPQLVHLATDGEAYGHHKRFGDMALAYVLDRLERDEGVTLTNYGAWLQRHPPTHEAEILEDTSWSCAHGIERWRSDCGCNTGAHPEWNQAWRGPLRDALDGLRDAVAPRFEERAAAVFDDPWAARNGYSAVVCNRTPETVDAFLRTHAKHDLGPERRIEALKLMELQRHAMLMYASCGWFFDDVAGIEGVQVLRYAGRVVDLAMELFGDGLDQPFLEQLALAKSNDPMAGDARRVFETVVVPSSVHLYTVAAHEALAGRFTDEADGAFSAYRTETLESSEQQADAAFLRVGRVHVSFPITEEQATFRFAAHHTGGTDIEVGVRTSTEAGDDRTVGARILDLFSRGETEDVSVLLRTEFGEHVSTLRDLLREEQRRLLNAMMQTMLEDLETSYRVNYERTEPVLQLLAELGIPIPSALRWVATFVINDDLERTARTSPLDGTRLDALFRQADEWNVPVDRQGLIAQWDRGLEAAVAAVAVAPGDARTLENLLAVVESVHRHEIPASLWAAQNAFYGLAEEGLLEARRRAAAGDAAASHWLATFEQLGHVLGMDTGDDAPPAKREL